MITRIVVPQLFENMEEATIGMWLKNEGDSVAQGEAVCELITEKSTFELESPGEGVLVHREAPEKSVVPVNFAIGLLGDAGEVTEQVLTDLRADNAALKESAAPNTPDGSSLTTPSLSVPSLHIPAAPDDTGSAPSGGGGRLRATPAARRLARELGVPIETVALNSPGKVLNEDDVREFAAR